MERGCSSYAPFKVGGCTWSETNLTVYNTAPNSFDPPYLRTKRDLATKARMTRCFCQGDRCNSTTSLFSWPLLLLITFGVAFLLK
ncbi:hypothetical protein WR25_08177 [Diploscapter pachys]|uniref:Uncharacterized protein n=1 Tax=Diploscapter pachys TaxID=2018661 RepID=A0A2A2KF69_9BILA|nr:hypothetical protein WR25_08177 [Diploscapter pachys]